MFTSSVLVPALFWANTHLQLSCNCCLRNSGTRSVIKRSRKIRYRYLQSTVHYSFWRKHRFAWENLILWKSLHRFCKLIRPVVTTNLPVPLLVAGTLQHLQRWWPAAALSGQPHPSGWPQSNQRNKRYYKKKGFSFIKIRFRLRKTITQQGVQEKVLWSRSAFGPARGLKISTPAPGHDRG